MSSFVVPFIEISPITKVKTIVYTKMQIVVENIQVGDNVANIKVILWTEAQDEIREFMYVIQGEEYKQWQDDIYLIQYVKGKLRNENL